MRSPRVRRWRRALVLSVVLVVSAQWAATAADDPPEQGPYPGLPKITGGGSWSGAAQGGITEAAKARQWAQVPMMVAAARVKNSTILPPGDPTNGYADGGGLLWTIFTFFVSPVGSEDNYGISPKFTVRTVAFGAIPVEATLQLVQRHESNGLPAPIVLSASVLNYNQRLGNQYAMYGDTTVDDVVTVRVTRLVVDGVDLALGGRCQTAEPGRLSLLGKGWKQPGDVDVNVSAPWLTGNYFPPGGGVLNGSVDVPAFAGCVTSGGEDVSRLLTSTVSGPDNAVTLNVSGPVCGVGITAPPPGHTTTESCGTIPPQIEIPERQ